MAPFRHALNALAAITILATLSACTESDQQQAPAPPPRDVDVAQIETADLPVSFEFIGRTASSQRVEIRTRVAGFLDEVAYEEGKRVKQGDVLFKIDPAPFEARLRAAKAELAQLEARLENAEALLRRVKPLAEIEAVAQKELDDAQGSVREAAAAVEAAKARVFEAELDLGYTTITSPVEGLTSSATQREGAYLGIGSEPLTYVARINPIWVEFSVSEAQALRSRQAQVSGSMIIPEDKRFAVNIKLSDGTLFPNTGHISFADASVDDQTGTFLVRAEIPNVDTEPLRPGQYVRVYTSGAIRPDAILAPKRAVQQGPRGSFVWLVDDENKAEQRPVVTGPWVNDNWVIEQGLNAGDRVIVNGSLGLTPGTPVNIVSLVPIDHPENGAIE
ncbi:efflux RND transporter periplasmic adaptor subunit [Mucisphaera calidilacus]|uniref:Multidrug export protein AcrE n=1 Tax=Mucisphaera calidilacus TaxID=2527982 RepID=A0A518BVT1_9BACT|nr:efflux RND transporter periplasmic adaptor subunit [Mucisphaera calidilacus]QDU71090.1 Multidrug export protein AcrE precursor [Mucisphaera calidilacus]